MKNYDYYRKSVLISMLSERNLTFRSYKYRIFSYILTYTTTVEQLNKPAIIHSHFAHAKLQIILQIRIL